ncbi:MAG: radical SAM protein [Thermoprotei archaeon]|nr:MAG: radical SAM protein [Thermoprotei archaeon]
MFVIGPGPYISSLCYSVLKIEPYDFCSLNCVYCYANWYSRKTRRVVGEFEKIAKKLKKRGLKTIPFRLSTLTEPFQPIEQARKLSLRILKISRKYSIPLIINTKSTIVLKDPWKSEILKLHDKSLVVLQITLITHREELARKLEPRAPSPRERLEICEYFSNQGIPVVVRLQPLIPGLFTEKEEIEEYFSLLKMAGVRQVIVEALRCRREDLETLIESPEYRDEKFWISYSPRKPEIDVIKPNREWIYGKLKELKNVAVKAGIGFTTCKEGLFNLHTVPNCCGIHYLEDYRLRPTLYEFWKYGKLYSGEGLNFLENEKYLYGEKLNEYPRIVRKGLKIHEKILLEILSEPEILAKIILK